MFYLYFQNRIQKSVKMNRLKEVLKQKGMKNVRLAEKLGKSYNMVNSYVQNRRQPSIKSLYKIAEVLNCEARELLKEREIN